MSQANAAFALALALPLAIMPFQRQSALKDENRRPTPPPALPRTLAELDEYPQRFEVYFDDAFGLRRPLAKLDRSLQRRLFGRIVSKQVLEGREGWLFYAAEDAVSLYRREKPFMPQQVAAIGDQIEKRAAYATSQGAKYLFAVAPDKHTLYPEYMPFHLRPYDRPSRYDQVMAMAQARGLPALDLRPALQAAKGEAQIYFRTDTHWNPRGGYVGYRELMAKLAPPGRTLAPIAFDAFEEKELFGADLPRLGGLPQSEKMIGLRANPSACSDAVVLFEGEGEGVNSMRRSQCADAPGRLLVYHDSFGGYLMPFLAASFGEVHYVWMRPSFERLQRDVARFKPDAILEIRVERVLADPLRDVDPPPKASSNAAAQR